MPYEFSRPGFVTISSDTRIGLYEEIDKFVIEHNPDTMSIRSLNQGHISQITEGSGLGSRKVGSEFPVPTIPLYRNKKWSVMYGYTKSED